MAKHDEPSLLGFDVDPKQLAHDLAIAKLTNDESLKFVSTSQSRGNSHSQELDDKYYQAYLSWYHQFLAIIDDRTRQDLRKY